MPLITLPCAGIIDPMEMITDAKSNSKTKDANVFCIFISSSP
jgi:hypothetical protein